MSIQGRAALTLQGDTKSFAPGARIQGRGTWVLEAAPKSIAINLFWYTEGRGTRDLGLVAQVEVAPPTQRGERGFDFTIPNLPYSFSGKLISVMWAVELIVDGGDITERVEIVVSPTLQEVRLVPTIDDEDEGEAEPL